MYFEVSVRILGEISWMLMVLAAVFPVVENEDDDDDAGIEFWLQFIKFFPLPVEYRCMETMMIEPVLVNACANCYTLCCSFRVIRNLNNESRYTRSHEHFNHSHRQTAHNNESQLNLKMNTLSSYSKTI